MQRIGPPDPHRALDWSLTNHPPVSDAVVVTFERIRQAAKALGAEILNECPESRERSLAITKLEETVMWAVKAVACHQEEEPGGS